MGEVFRKQHIARWRDDEVGQQGPPVARVTVTLDREGLFAAKATTYSCTRYGHYPELEVKSGPRAKRWLSLSVSFINRDLLAVSGERVNGYRICSGGAVQCEVWVLVDQASEAETAMRKAIIASIAREAAALQAMATAAKLQLEK